MNLKALATFTSLAVLATVSAVDAGSGSRKKKAPVPTPVPASATPASVTPVAESRLRIWKPALAHHGELKLVWKSAGAKTGVELLGGAAGDQFMEDSSVPAGAGELQVFDKAEPQGKPKFELQGNLAPNTSSILLITETPDGVGLKADWIRQGSESTIGGEFMAYNFIPGLKDCRITLGTSVNVAATAVGMDVRLRGLKRSFTPFSVTGEDSAGKTFHWTSEIDFSKAPRAMVLVCLDQYGRVRPRLILESDQPGGR